MIKLVQQMLMRRKCSRLMQAVKQLSHPWVLSVALCLSVCKLATAEEAPSRPSFWDGFQVGGYSSAGLTLHSRGDTEASWNEFSLIVTWDNETRWRFFSELELEEPLQWREGNSIETHQSYLDLERFYFDYNLSEKVNLRAGRFLTPAGRWNLLHAAPLVWTTTRPLVTRRMFPNSTNGGMFFGAVPLENLGLEYNVFVEALKDQHQDGEEILFKEIRGAHVGLTGKANVGLTLMEFKERVAGDPQFRMIGFDVLYKQNGWEWSGEGYQRFYTDGKNGGSGAYLQAVAPLGQQWYAVARAETFQRPKDDAVERVLLGVVWKRTPNQLLKIEVTGGQGEAPETPKGLLTSFAILF